MGYLYNVFDISAVFLLFGIGFYSILALQWYSYSVMRTICKHHKIRWHFYYFILPISAFLLSCVFFNEYLTYLFCAYVFLIYLPMLGYLHFKLDKKLVFTNRVKRFFLIYFAFIFIFEYLSTASHTLCRSSIFYFIMAILSLIFAIAVSNLGEMLLLNRYTQLAKDKIYNMNLQVILITASFGKTSIKNFIFHILNSKYKVYATPRSVNTFVGLVSDINNNIQEDCKYYIAEAGARAKGDIAKILSLVEPTYVVLGEIGAAHLEYFKTIDNIIETKCEILQSDHTLKAFVYGKNAIPKDLLEAKKNIISYYPPIIDGRPAIKDMRSDLSGTSFSLFINSQWVEFHTAILGKFNIENLIAAIMLSNELNIDMQSIQKAVQSMPFVPHRLQKIEAMGKIILDDSFNGNYEGMKEGIRLSSLHNGKKIIVTPGLVESSEELNIKIAKMIDEVFHIVIITGELNSKLMSANISRPQKIILKDKSNLQTILKSVSASGDIIYFANDAPTYI